MLAQRLLTEHEDAAQAQAEAKQVLETHRGVRHLNVEGNPLMQARGEEQEVWVKLVQSLTSLVALNRCCITRQTCAAAPRSHASSSAPVAFPLAAAGLCGDRKAGVGKGQGGVRKSAEASSGRVDIVLDGCLTRMVRAELVVLARALGRRGPSCCKSAGDGSAGGCSHRHLDPSCALACELARSNACWVRRISLRRCHLRVLCEEEGCGVGELVRLLGQVLAACAGEGGGVEELDIRENDLDVAGQDVGHALLELAGNRHLAIVNGVSLRNGSGGAGGRGGEVAVGDLRGDRNWRHLEAVVFKGALERIPASLGGRGWGDVTVCRLEGNQDLRSRGVCEAARALRACPALQELRMGLCGAGLKGARAVAESVPHWRGLTGLYFGGNYAGNEGCMALLLALAGVAPTHVHEGDWGRKLCRLQRLDLSQNCIGSWALREVAAASGEHEVVGENVSHFAANASWWMCGSEWWGGGQGARVWSVGDGSAKRHAGNRGKRQEGEAARGRNVQEVMAMLAPALCELNLSGNCLASASVGIVRGLAEGSPASRTSDCQGGNEGGGAPQSEPAHQLEVLKLDLSGCRIGAVDFRAGVWTWRAPTDKGTGGSACRQMQVQAEVREVDEIDWSVAALAEAVAALAARRQVDVELKDNGALEFRWDPPRNPQPSTLNPRALTSTA
jgi:hypothetical protein